MVALGPIQTFRLFAVAVVATAVLIVWAGGKLTDHGPRGARRIFKGCFYTGLAVAGVAIVVAWIERGAPPRFTSTSGIFFVLGIATLILSFAHDAFRQLTDKEALQNYKADHTRCGRCDYRLRDNVSDVCPECGWEVPDRSRPIEDSDWFMWWRQWRIDHLASWRRTLVEMLVIAAVLTVMFWGMLTEVIASTGHWSIPALAAPFCVLEPIPKPFVGCCV